MCFEINGLKPLKLTILRFFNQEKINIPKEWLSDYCLEIANAHNITTGTVKKILPNLMNKNNYVIHYRNLQQCLELKNT